MASLKPKGRITIRVSALVKMIGCAVVLLWSAEITALTLQLQNRAVPSPQAKHYDQELSNLKVEVQNLKNKVATLQSSLATATRGLNALQKQVDGFVYKGVLAFLHIGKVGGTSFDGLGQEIANEIQYLYYGKRHFDWSVVEKIKVWRDNLPVDVVMLIREPVQRAVSHFYYWKTLNFTQGSKMVNQSLSDYLFDGDQQNLLDTRDIWQDGQAGVSWLTGTHIAGWVVPRITPKMVEGRERMSMNVSAMLPLAAARLRETKWFGILEDLNRSMILLQHTYNLTNVPTLPDKNRNNHTKPEITEKESEAMASLMPQDLWLYEYAKLLFEARWQEYKTGVYVEPTEPPIPITLPCVSTRFQIWCNSGPLAKYFPVPVSNQPK